MSNKQFQVQIEVILDREVTVWAESFDDAIAKAERMSVKDVISEGYNNDHEMRVIGVRRNKLSRMYRDD